MAWGFIRMTAASCRLAFACLCCLPVACSSSQSEGPDIQPIEEPPGRGRGTGGSPSDARAAPDATPVDVAAETAGDGAGGDAVADVADAPAADRPEAADALPDAARDLPVDRPPAANGEKCALAAECKSKFCIDGVCCENTCDSPDPDRCRACTNARTGQKDGVCAADKTREGVKCGEACGQLVMAGPAVMTMVCHAGACAVPANPTVVGDPCKTTGDNCTVSFCDQPTNRTARCVHTLCPQANTCCCEQPGNAAQRTCVAMDACRNDKARMCVTQ